MNSVASSAAATPSSGVAVGRRHRRHLGVDDRLEPIGDDLRQLLHLPAQPPLRHGPQPPGPGQLQQVHPPFGGRPPFPATRRSAADRRPATRAFPPTVATVVPIRSRSVSTSML
ncbi:hypothetical protein AB0J83_37290 [Actinoplanes sp. NPDC049596]|uniref:hypothetical protein n=1 Tax=unclassified Actinoplanes TaxID=2626549 RepID=UPI00343D9FE9